MRAKNKQHSDGPWIAIEAPLGFTILMKQQQRHIASMPAEGNQANARLVAYAPDMYDMLEQANHVMAVAHRMLERHTNFETTATSLSICLGKIESLLEKIDGFEKKEDKQ